MDSIDEPKSFAEVVEAVAKEVAIDYLLGTNKLEESSERQKTEFNILQALKDENEEALGNYSNSSNETYIIFQSSLSMLNAMLNVLYAEIDNPRYMEDDEKSKLKTEANADKIKSYLLKFMSLDRFMNELMKELDVNANELK